MSIVPGAPLLSCALQFFTGSLGSFAGFGFPGSVEASVLGLRGGCVVIAVGSEEGVFCFS